MGELSLVSDRTCRRCRFWNNGKSEHVGLCRRLPPTIVHEPGTTRLDGFWPATEPQDWCGEFESKTGEP